MDIYRGWFSQNGRCGYVLKPSCLRQPWTVFNAFKKEIMNDTEPMYLRIKLISGQQLPLPRGASVKASSIDPYVLLQVFGIPADCAEARTKTVSNEGQSPIFDESFEFTISAPQLAVLRLTVLDDDFIGDDFIGQRSLPVSSLRPGYRHVTLLADSGHPLLHATLFVHITMCSRSSNDKKLRRKRSWQTKMAAGGGISDLRPTGLKPVDETCRNGVALLTECAKLKAALDKAMIELCEECGLPTSSNLAQCLRILVQRVAGCPDITSFGLDTSGLFPEVRIQGEPSGPKSAKCLQCFERVLQESTYVVQNAQQLSDGLKDLYNNIQLHATELPSLCSSQKSKKADKAAENFIWNAAFIESRIETVASLTHECQAYLNQITRLRGAVERIFAREKNLLQPSASAATATATGSLSGQSQAGSTAPVRTRTSSSLSITPPAQLSSSAPATPPPISPSPDHPSTTRPAAAPHKKGILKKPSSPIQISQQDLTTSL
ncbi:inactive phospholipase C protein 1-like [Tropilaelaps mercedesae]|uniref:Inactive phospholipase C protein 1-like n=1 Tax=Tropilaelaps mercedesae TaxID=418985 RepID=A0A1V9Y3I6_9ACAR|nr:inactive phospholipase C protein 1-like [Tropilaelaps mercedesae]